MNVGIIGSLERKKEKENIKKLISSLPEGTIIVTGGEKKGFDSWIAEAAEEFSRPTMAFLPYKPPEDASPREYLRSQQARNRKIVQNSDIIYAYPSEDRTGDVEDIITLALNLNANIEIK
ncbi:MAG: hypothetical protein CME70_19420 [Halobacteriovorax sp.]|nr:hypothetical protein [Halobacteriovorax sp.]MBK26177.1 hypothetical protein [Halobacteriovorax sp.]|tara:strand:+ start:2653 stop:3012 length:360 start_codon:yes stop_codon:yes gene_type:complete